MNKAARLRLIRERVRLMSETDAFGELPLNGREQNEEIKEMDTFREESRANASVKGVINSDER
jgi:hypothetical protein